MFVCIMEKMLCESYLLFKDMNSRSVTELLYLSLLVLCLADVLLSDKSFFFMKTINYQASAFLCFTLLFSTFYVVFMSFYWLCYFCQAGCVFGRVFMCHSFWKRDSPKNLEQILIKLCWRDPTWHNLLKFA